MRVFRVSHFHQNYNGIGRPAGLYTEPRGVRATVCFVALPREGGGEK